MSVSIYRDIRWIWLTSYTSEQLFGELLNMGARERNECVRLEEIEHALTIKVGDDADVVPEIEAVP
jgi:hypothetical protein